MIGTKMDLTCAQYLSFDLPKKKQKKKKKSTDVHITEHLIWTDNLSTFFSNKVTKGWSLAFTGTINLRPKTTIRCSLVWVKSKQFSQFKHSRLRQRERNRHLRLKSTSTSWMSHSFAWCASDSLWIVTIHVNIKDVKYYSVSVHNCVGGCSEDLAVK